MPEQKPEPYRVGLTEEEAAAIERGWIEEDAGEESALEESGEVADAPALNIPSVDEISW